MLACTAKLCDGLRELEFLLSVVSRALRRAPREIERESSAGVAPFRERAPSAARTLQMLLSFALASSSFVAPGSRLSTQVSRGASVCMGSTADFKNGLTLEDEGSVWKITSFLHVRWHVDMAVLVVPQLTTPVL